MTDTQSDADFAVIFGVFLAIEDQLFDCSITDESAIAFTLT